MSSDLSELVRILASFVPSISSFGYFLGNLVLLIIVAFNLRICRAMWFLLAGLAGRTSLSAAHILLMTVGGSSSTFYSTWIGLYQLVGLASVLLEVVGIAGLIFSYRRKFDATRAIDYSVWTQP